MAETIKKPSWALGAILGSLLAIALGGTYVYYKIILGKALTPLDAAKLVPDEALMATYIVTEPKVWSQMSEFGTTEAQEIMGKTWQELTPNITAISNINYDQDIKPWLGNIMFAVLPQKEEKEGENILMVVGITNKAKALQFALKVKQDLKDLEEKEYKDYPISSGTTKENEPLSFALVNDYLIVGSNPNIINSAIDSFQGEASFATAMKDTAIFNRDLGLKTPLAQIYLPNYSALVEEGFNTAETISNEEKSEEKSEEIPEEILKEFNQIESAVIGVGLEKEGLHFQAITKLNSEVNFDYLQLSEGKILDQFPSETFLLFTGQGLSKIWTDAIKQFEDIPEFKTPIDEARKNIKKELNLDLDRDILGWMNGEIGFGLINSNQGALSIIGIGGVLAIQTTDRPTAEKTINTLTDYYKKELSPFILSSDKKIDEINVIEWKDAMQQYILGYGWTKKDTFLMTLGTPFDNFLTLTKENSLANSKIFQEITQSLPKDNLGYFYFDLEKTKQVIQKGEKLSGQSIPSEAKAFLYSIKGIASTSTLPEDFILQSDLILSLEKTEK